TATVSPVAPGAGTPTGTVSFLDGGTSLGTATLTNGTATFTTTALTQGSHTITAVYSGDSNFITSTSAGVSQTVNLTAAPSTISLDSSVNPSVFGQVITLVATVTPSPPATGIPTGTVTFRDGTTVLGTVALDANGRAPFQTGALSIGAHFLNAVYNGDGNFASSITLLFIQQVTRANTLTTVASSLNPSLFGQAVTFTATVSAVAP